MNTLKALTLDGLKSFYIKYIKPIKNAAYCTVVNNGTTTTSNTVLDGRMGKTLADKDANLQRQINTLNQLLSLQQMVQQYMRHKAVGKKLVISYLFPFVLN